MSQINKRLFYSETGLHHQVSAGHPECPQRLEAIVSRLENSPHPDIHTWEWCEPKAVDPTWFHHAHPQHYVNDMFAQLPESGIVILDNDTCWSAQSWDAVCHGGGALKQAIDELMTEHGYAFCLSRPPGHHAEKATAMGFCIMGLVACAALYALSAHDLQRVAILDFDVHHGNGTEDIVGENPNIFFASSYQQDIYPSGTVPRQDATKIHLPLPAHAGGDYFRQQWEDKIFKPLVAFQPELILVSAGFDAHINDPLASCDLHESDYQWLGERIAAIAKSNGQRVVATLEGGYDLSALASSVEAFLIGLSTD